MESLVGVPNSSHLLVHLARSLASVLISLIGRVSSECPEQHESFRRALVPLYQVLGNFLGRTPYDLMLPSSSSSSHSLILRDAPHHQPFRTLPSLGPHHQTDFHPRISGSHDDATVNPCERLTNDGNFRPPLTPPGGSWSHCVAGGSPIGYTSTPHRTPVQRPRQPEQFALINQLLTAMRTSEDSGIGHATEQFADDPIFRHRLLSELDQLRALVDRDGVGASSTVAGLMGRIERAEITLSSLVHNLEHLHNLTRAHTDE
ncbi:uncharacterized protein LOC118463713 [Anopheles albimanus]|uniref:Uncharacterized protein n=1 Tax=Anopheles albimanus TaxID=7167 RepID=A0A182FDH2_ANOAL|nr:uncharacterized protein LOC118463713 [Anopheles albimanus]